MLTADREKLTVLRTYPTSQSLGHFYARSIFVLGFHPFDEYKVMGLAPYGQACRYRHLFRQVYELKPGGAYTLDLPELRVLLTVVAPRRAHEPLTEAHADLAAALQESLEELVFHIVTHFARETGHTNLCLAGGVAHNCSVNGKLLQSGLFKRLFVQPAAHDAGCAIGASLYIQQRDEPCRPLTPLRHVFLGPSVGTDARIRRELQRWKAWVAFERVDDIAQVTARLLADGHVSGWVQGRSEFGPRALGHRVLPARDCGSRQSRDGARRGAHRR